MITIQRKYMLLPDDCIQANIDDDTFNQLIILCLENNISYDSIVNIINNICLIVDPYAEAIRVIMAKPNKQFTIVFKCNNISLNMLNKLHTLNRMIQQCESLVFKPNLIIIRNKCKRSEQSM